MTGTVKTVQVDRGYFFIRCDDGSADLFAHCSQLQGLEFDATLQERAVAFDRGIDPRSGRERATRVRPAI